MFLALSLPKTKIKTWATHEVNGLIMFWYDSNDEPPKWSPLENSDIIGLKLTGTTIVTCTGHFLVNPSDNTIS